MHYELTDADGDVIDVFADEAGALSHIRWWYGPPTLGEPQPHHPSGTSREVTVEASTLKLFLIHVEEDPS